jgi:RHS repeat-associated protein
MIASKNNAFGMVMPERSFSYEKYRWGFNGKETDNEVKGAGNSLDFGARIYDCRLGRFLSVDPLFKVTSFYTPYLFAGNKPVSAIDKGGLLEVIVHYLHKSPNGDVSEQYTYKYNITTAEDIKGISRSTLHVNVNTADVPVTVGTSTTFEYKVISWSIVPGTGLTDMVVMKRNSPMEYYAMYWAGKFIINNPLGTGQLAMGTQSRDPFTGEYKTTNSRAINIFQGLADMASLGLASRSGASGILSHSLWALADLGVEESLSKLSEAFGLDNDQKSIFGYHITRLAARASAGDIKTFQEAIIEFADKGIKGAEMVEQLRMKTGIDLNVPMDTKEAAKKAINLSQGNE